MKKTNILTESEVNELIETIVDMWEPDNYMDLDGDFVSGIYTMGHIDCQGSLNDLSVIYYDDYDMAHPITGEELKEIEQRLSDALDVAYREWESDMADDLGMSVDEYRWRSGCYFEY